MAGGFLRASRRCLNNDSALYVCLKVWAPRHAYAIPDALRVGRAEAGSERASEAGFCRRIEEGGSIAAKRKESQLAGGWSTLLAKNWKKSNSCILLRICRFVSLRHHAITAGPNALFFGMATPGNIAGVIGRVRFPTDMFRPTLIYAVNINKYRY